MSEGLRAPRIAIHRVGWPEADWLIMRQTSVSGL